MTITQTLFLQESGDTSAVSINDVNQGWLGDCWLCAPLAALASQNPDYIKNMIRDNGDGTQTVRLYLTPSEELASQFTVTADGSTWITVNDSNLGQGMNTNNGGQLIVNGAQEIWPQVIENAIAQVLGGYSALNSGGFSSTVMQMLTGNAATISPLFGGFYQLPTAQLQADLAAGDMVTFLTGAPDDYGLVDDHVYTLTSVDTENGIDYAHFRNPWGSDNPAPVPVSYLSSAFLLMTVGTVPSIVDTTSPSNTGTSATDTPTTSTSTSPTTSVPSAASGLVIDVSEDAYHGDAQFVVTVDGQQVGDVMTATALHDQGQTQAVDIGSLAIGQHTIGVTFLNDLYAGTPETDRNLYVDQVYYNGQAVAGPQTLLSSGTVDFAVTDDQSTASTTSTSTSPTTSAPSATSGLVIDVSEDAYHGDAQFVVTVDGQQVGDVMTATALHDQGQTQAVDIGSLAIGQHTIGVTFLNDLYAGTPETDRNLYVDQVYYNGPSVARPQTLLSDGSVDFSVTGDQPTASTGSTTTSSSTTGISTTGTSTPVSGDLVVNVSEDAYQGDAQFTVSMNGQQVGGVMTATALHDQDQTQAFDLGNVLSPGQHTIGVTFLNDAYAGTPQTDRNLYVDGITVGGQSQPNASAALDSAGTSDFSVTEASSVTPITSNAVLNVSEDAYQGDAQFTVSVDGKQYGGVYTATASHAAGQSQAVTVSGIPELFQAHDIAVTFLNDAYAGTPETDRNLYVNSVQFDAQTVPGASLSLYSAGTQNVTAMAPTNWLGST